MTGCDWMVNILIVVLFELLWGSAENKVWFVWAPSKAFQNLSLTNNAHENADNRMQFTFYEYETLPRSECPIKWKFFVIEFVVNYSFIQSAPCKP